MSRDAARFLVKRAGDEEEADSLSVLLDDLRDSRLDEVGDILVGDLGRSLAREFETVVVSPSAMAKTPRNSPRGVIVQSTNGAILKLEYAQ